MPPWFGRWRTLLLEIGNLAPQFRVYIENGLAFDTSILCKGGVYGTEPEFDAGARNGCRAQSHVGLDLAVYPLWTIPGRSTAPGSQQEWGAPKAAGQGVSSFAGAYRKARRSGHARGAARAAVPGGKARPQRRQRPPHG